VVCPKHPRFIVAPSLHKDDTFLQEIWTLCIRILLPKADQLGSFSSICGSCNS
jgi:hypothetical protein